MNNTNTDEKCFMVAFGENELAGKAERKITSVIYRNLCPPTSDSDKGEWVHPAGTSTRNTNLSNVFFVKGKISEIKLSNFYREIVEPIVKDELNINKGQVYFYIKEVEDDEVSFQI